jgi:hypothetical protein
MATFPDDECVDVVLDEVQYEFIPADRWERDRLFTRTAHGLVADEDLDGDIRHENAGYSCTAIIRAGKRETTERQDECCDPILKIMADFNSHGDDRVLGRAYRQGMARQYEGEDMLTSGSNTTWAKAYVMGRELADEINWEK